MDCKMKVVIFVYCVSGLESWFNEDSMMVIAEVEKKDKYFLLANEYVRLWLKLWLWLENERKMKNYSKNRIAILEYTFASVSPGYYILII